MMIPLEILTIVSRVISVLFLLLLLNFSRMIVVRSKFTAMTGPSMFKGYIKVIHGLGLLGFTSILIVQAYWQLAAFTNPKFLSAAKLYDKRTPNYALQLKRGEILDRNGTILAGNKYDNQRYARYYPYHEVTSHLIGYDHPKFGKTGIENGRDAYLTGQTMGSRPELQTILYNVIRHGRMRGNDLKSTVDLRLQREAAALMKGRRGAVVVMDVWTGDILVWLSVPGFDPNLLNDELFSKDDPSARLLDRVSNGFYPPGSTYKILMAMTAIQNNLGKNYSCTGTGYAPIIEERPINDHEYYEALEQNKKWSGHGRIGLSQAFTHSCNVYFAQLGVSLGYDRIAAAHKAFGFDEEIIIFDGTTWDGQLKGPKCRFPAANKVDLIDLTRISIGQGELLVTPLHFAVAVNAMANNGVVVWPRLDLHSAVRTRSTIGTSENCAALKTLMEKVVETGTGRVARSPRVAIAGKTGTAENPLGPGHAWFVGFAPVKTPAVSFVVLIENTGFASQSAVPLARKLMEKAEELGIFDESSKVQPSPEHQVR